LDPVVTDQGKPGLSYAWTLESGPAGVTIDDICDDPCALDPIFTFEELEVHTLKLTVTDGSDNISAASIDVTVIEYYRALRLEAEEGTIKAGDTSPEIRIDDLASENRLMWTTWSGTDRGSFVLNFDVEEAGTYDMIIRYKIGGTGARGDKVKINGLPEEPGDTSFPGTDDIFEDFEYGPVDLNKGNNTIEIIGSWGGISYDYIEFPFMEAPQEPYDPDPENWETVPTNGVTNLSWSFDPNIPTSVVTSMVYFGDSEPEPTEPDFGMTKINAGSATTVPVPETLLDNTTYYWFLIATDSDVTGEIQGKLWRFSTLPPCEFYALTGDVDLDCDVDLEDFQLLAREWLADDGYEMGDYMDIVANWLSCIDPATGEPISCR